MNHALHAVTLVVALIAVPKSLAAADGSSFAQAGGGRWTPVNPTAHGPTVIIQPVPPPVPVAHPPCMTAAERADLVARHVDMTGVTTFPPCTPAEEAAYQAALYQAQTQPQNPTGPGQGGDGSNFTPCLSIIRAQNSNQCGDPNGAIVIIHNGCGRAVEIGICIQEPTRMQCGQDTVADGHNTNLYSCHATSPFRYFYRGCMPQTSCHP